MNSSGVPPFENRPHVPPPDYSIERDLGLAVKICSGCHTPNLPTSQYCYKCGLRLPEQAIMPNEMILANPAGFWRRFASFIIDNIFIGMSTLVISYIVFAIIFAISPDVVDRHSITEFIWESDMTSVDLEMTWLDWLTYLGGPVIEMAYWTIAVGWKGRTVGKLMLGMKVVRSDGSRVGYWRAFGRYWGYILCYMTFGIGFLVIGWNKQKRGLHDLVCDTMVIRI